jgi:outer membrane protein OmpA-like peptidoglycan-associated protein/tetratricopeptide (TPR) repeat protein
MYFLITKFHNRQDFFKKQIKMKARLLLIFFIYNLSFSQTEKTKIADFLFKQYEYEKAAEKYEKIVINDKLDSNTYVLKQLADCYYYTSNYSEAEKWYEKALQKEIEKETLYRYSQVLKLNGKEKDSYIQMDVFKKKYPNDLRSKNYDISLSTQKFEVVKTSFNSLNSDFGASYSNNKIYFASARNLSNKKFAWNNEPYLDIYETNYSNGEFSEPVPLTEINSAYNDGPVTITGDGKTMYFSSESQRLKNYNKIPKDKLKYSKNMIFKASLVNSKWENIICLPINDIAFSSSNPCVSRDGKTLYFSSDRPGGFGGVDIWKVAIDNNGMPLGSPENLGNIINTEANESFPFISDDNSKLYFSSNGRNGFGAYDIYFYEFFKQEGVKNLGNTINSKSDDFAFSFSENTKLGFLSSNREGNDNIYIVKNTCQKAVDLSVLDEKTGQIIPNSSVTVLDENKTLIYNLTTDTNGKINFELECDKKYEIVTTKSKYENKLTPIESNKAETNKIVVNLSPIDIIITDTEVILKPIYFELNKANITPQGATELNKLINVMIQNPSMKIFAKSHTDSRGSDESNLVLSQKRAQSTVNYIISQGIESNRITGKGYGETEPKIKCLDCTEIEHAQNRRSEFLIITK